MTGECLKLYKFVSLDKLERILDILINERLYCANYKELNDPFEGQFLSEGIHSAETLKKYPMFQWINWGKYTRRSSVDDLFSSIPLPRICSLSTESHDVRMWSYYANSHRGAAIEIGFDTLDFELHKVDYVEAISKYSDSLLGMPSAIKVLTQKTNHWTYEAEYRILTEKKYYPIQGKISAVLFGIRADIEQVRLIEKATQKKFKSVFCELDINKARIERKDIGP